MKHSKYGGTLLTQNEIELEMGPDGVIVAVYGDDRGSPKLNAKTVDTLELERTADGLVIKKLRKVQKTQDLHDRLLGAERITIEEFDAFERFSRAFQTLYSSQISSVSAFERIPRGQPTETMPERVVAARGTVNGAIDVVGGHKSLPGACLWYTGWGESLTNFARRRQINKNMATGVFVAALATLAKSKHW